MFLIEKGSWKREKYSFFISNLVLIPFNIIRRKKRVSKSVESHYDKISGSYIQDNYYVDKPRYCIFENQIKSLSNIELMKNIRRECNEVLSELNFYSVLEVGIGELTTMESVVSKNKNLKQVFGIDLSLNRMLHGLEEYKKRQTLIPELSKSNAINLPFKDFIFDLVYSRHTLEQMPLTFKEAISEMIRVSNRHIVLFEPSYEKGGFAQKLKMIRKDYFRGLDKFLSANPDVKIVKSFLMKNCVNPLNRTYCYVLEKISAVNHEKSSIGFVCPYSKEKLVKKDGFLYSPISRLAYPLIEGVPILDKEYSFYVDSPASRKWN